MEMAVFDFLTGWCEDVAIVYLQKFECSVSDVEFILFNRMYLATCFAF